MPRWNLEGKIEQVLPRLDHGSYKVHVHYIPAGADRFFGALTVTRTPDGTVIFPHPGAPEIGPFCTGYEAREAARLFARKVIESDIANPQP